MTKFLYYLSQKSEAQKNGNWALQNTSFQTGITIGLSPKATVTTVWKTPLCKRGVLKCPVSYVLNFRGWIKLIQDKITLIYSVKNAFNPTSEVQNIENGVFQNAPFANGRYPNESFRNGYFVKLCFYCFEFELHRLNQIVFSL